MAVNGGILVKQGDMVMVATRVAVSGELGLLHETVNRFMNDLDERERKARSAVARLEADFVRRFVEFGKKCLMMRQKHGKRFSREIDIREKRKLRARNQKADEVWFGLGLFGVVGWAVAIPTVLGIFLGVWIDLKWPSSYSLDSHAPHDRPHCGVS